MPITAYAPNEVLTSGKAGDGLLDEVLIQINNRLKEKPTHFGNSIISIRLAEKPPLEYKKLNDKQKITFFLLLRSEYTREGWRDLVLHTADATGAECFSVELWL